ncbi:MAG: CotH kinase family protein [Acidimicrobiales bacterium]
MSIRTTLCAVGVAALLVSACGGSDDPAAEESSAEAANAASTSESETVSADGTALFDASVVHDLELSYVQEDYDAMIATLADTGEKEWIEVTVTIDGVTYERAGARLKGNSSLAGLSGGFGGGPGGGLAGGDAADRPELPDGAGGAGGRPGGFGGGGVGGGVSADDPEGLPWLIRLDQFVEGQQHQGYVDIVVRSNNSQTSLNEAVALDLLREAGLASQEAAHVAFSVNGGDAALRLMIEHPSDDAWQDSSFADSGALYKAESTGDWSYRGDDPDSYNDVFDQEGGKKVADLTPLIDFLQFINESDDATFADELADRLDIESFATYLAMMELVQNFDDIDGPGNNSYLWWDASSEQFTVVPWDMNLAFGGLGGGGGFGGGGFPPGGAPDGAPANGEIPEGFEPPEDGDLPEGFAPPEGFEQGRGGAGGFGRSNTLVERFHANDEFEALYQQQLDDLEASLFESGTAEQLLADRASVLTEQATALVDAATVEQEANSIAESMRRQ